MLKIDNNLLQEVGLGALPAAEKNSFLKHIYETLEMRVGIRLADQMTNQQLDEFERYFEAKDDAGAFKWLETNFPNYKEIVQQEFDKLKAEVAQSAPQILAASQQQPQSQQPQQPMAQQPAPAPAPQATGQPPYQSQPVQPQQQPQYPPQQPVVQQPQAEQQPVQQPQSQPGQPNPSQQQPPFPTQQPPAGPTFNQ
ncbi:MAG TPA: DUF5663 domain-containing protein [Candidatus Saccharimonadales bacterium]|nr:DUF5663 domain-containing protein [Candidatus Saccharimonadales bacterium]